MSPSIRLTTLKPRNTDPRKRGVSAGYTMADANLSRRFTGHVEGLLQIQNLMDGYHDDTGNYSAVLGRQTKIGFRLR